MNTQGADPLLILEAIERTAKDRPQSAALESGELRVTYSELHGALSEVAQKMRAFGAGPGEFVALALPRGPEMVISMLATLQVGAAFVPIDAALPEHRREMILQDLGNVLVWTPDGPTSKLDRHQASFAHRDDPAYVIYTSGSTGVPKGVVIGRTALDAFSKTISQLFELGQEDRVLQFASFSFDACIEEIFPTLLAGGAIVLRGRSLWHPLELSRRVSESAVTVLDLPTAYWHEVCRFQSQEGKGLIPPSVRLVVIGGEAASPERLEEWQAFAPKNIRLLNTYGPTEATVTATYFDVSSQESLGFNSVPIGKALAGVRTYVMDRNLVEVPDGVPGELWLAGAGVARGYLNRPEATAERFLPEPGGGRMFRTGDLVVQRSSGDLEFLGRIDDQVKIRGFRVEPLEVETALLTHERVGNAAVVARPDVHGGQRLVAYFQPIGQLEPGELRAHVAEKLPEYMLPKTFVALPEFPMTSSGKIDRRALPEVTPDSEPGDRTGSGIEELLLTIWEEVLNLPTIGASQDFFELGGDSLLATRVISRIRSDLGVELPLDAVFENPLPTSLSRVVEDAIARRQLGRDPIRPVPVDCAEFPLSVEQERLWFFEQYSPGTNAYVIPAHATVRGSFHPHLFRKSLNVLAEHQPSLRTVFVEIDGQPRQKVLERLEPHFRFVDLTHVSASDTKFWIELAIGEEESVPFDLVNGPLLRALVAKTSDDTHFIQLWIHHLVADGWSLNVVADELSEIYSALVREQPPTQQPPPVTYRDFTVYQRDWLEGDDARSQLAEWKAELAQSPALDLPTDRIRPKVRAFSSNHHEFRISRSLLEAVQRLARESVCTNYMVLMSVFATLIGRYSRQDEVIVGSPVAGRKREEVERLIGFFVNILPNRIDLSDDPSFRQLLARVRQTTLRSLSRQDYPFERLVTELDPARDPSRSPLVEVMFVFHNAPAARLSLAGAESVELTSSTNAAPVDVTLDLTLDGEGLHGVIHYDAALFTPGTIARMAHHFEQLLEAAVRDPDTSIGGLDLVDADEKQLVVFDWNSTSTTYPSNRMVQDLFADQVLQNPEAVAVCFGDELLTYSELDRRSGSLAAHLASAGLQNGELVAVCLERSATMIVALLAILKAGGAYLPLDPDHPAERLALMMRDAGSKILITQRLLRESVPDAGSVVVIDVNDSAIWNLPPLRSKSQGTGESLAYVMYTSGSTGAPKGIRIPHRAIVRLVCGTDYLQLTSADVVAQASNASFDAATFEIWAPLLNGGRMVGVGKETLLSPLELESFIQEHAINTMFFTTALFNQVSQEAPQAFSKLEHLLFGGEAVDPNRVRAVLGAVPPRRLLHVYGPTESTTFATWHEVDHVPEHASTIPIGRPIANTTVYLLDPRRNPVPPGIPGEIYIGGDGLALGYLNRPELDAVLFVENPFAPGLLYKTGDLARFVGDGAIEFLGRLDDQVKIRGFRIEPGEVEAVALALPGVEEAAVTVREHSQGEKSLVAYVVAPELEAGAVRALLKEKLPPYMLPASIVPIQAMPLNPNGKLDRSALPEPEASREHLTSDFAPPREDFEMRLAEIWQEVLDVPAVGIYDDFFELGGHSLKATRLTWRVREVFGRDISLRDVFEHSSLEALAERVRVADQSPSENQIKKLPRNKGADR